MSNGFAKIMVMSAILCSFVLGNGTSGAQGTQSDKPAAPPAPAMAPDEAKPESASRVYEAVSGYLEGYHKKLRESSPKPRREDKFRPDRVKQSNPEENEYRGVLESEKRAAATRMQRREWDLAVRSIERALAAASNLNADQDAAGLREKLQEAKSNASKIRTGEVSPLGELTNAIGMKLVLIRPGKFRMGSSSSEIRRIEAEWAVEQDFLNNETPAHMVEISAPFFLGKYSVTVGQFKKFVSETGYRTVAERQGWGWVYDQERKHWVKKEGASWKNPGSKIDDDHPVTLVCYQDAEAFCKWLSSKDNREYFLPTEAQREYASRAGKEEKRFPWGDDYPDGRKLNMADRRSPVPWADQTVDDRHARTAPVGSYDPNGFWLYDMVGNVWELCSDYYSSKAYENEDSRTSVDPKGPARANARVIKGGNWAFGAGIARNAFRFGLAPDLCIDVTGFRVAAAAGRYEAAATKNADDARSRDLSLEQKATALLARVKSLTESGRRAEAQKLVEEFKKSVSKEEPRAGSGLDFVEQVLESMIDISQPKNLQSFTNSLKMKMVRVPAGAFIMGSSQTDIGWAMATLARDQPASLENEYPFHKVRISRPFFIGATEVTVAQFRAFVEETGYVTDAEDEGGGQVYNLQERAFERKSGATWKNPGWKIEDSQPVVMISYNDAQAFCDWLAAKEKLPYKLPTEAQWEYACRGGLPMSQFPWGDELPDGRRANYADKNTDFPWRDRYVDDGYKYVAPVGSYEPNGYGLYDMAGNALEWVRDFYGENYYRFSPEIDPEGPGQGENRVMKGGEWTFGPVNLRCAFRGWARQDLSFYNSGFRVAIDLANSRRAFHFSNTFLTKEWVPGPDQREIAGAIAKEKDRQRSVAKTGQKKVSAPTKQSGASPPVMGIRVLDFTPKSEAKKAGLIKGDVIIEYYGVRDLTSEKLLALTAQAKRQKAKPSLVFVRDGYEYTVKVGLGFLGVTVVDTSVRGPFKRPDFKPEREDQDRPRDERTKARDWT